MQHNLFLSHLRPPELYLPIYDETKNMITYQIVQISEKYPLISKSSVILEIYIISFFSKLRVGEKMSLMVAISLQGKADI